MPNRIIQIFKILVLAGLSSLAVATAALADEPEAKIFKDWRVLCDNARRCTAFTADTKGDRALLMLVREPGPYARPVLRLAVVDKEAAKGRQARWMVNARGELVGRFGAMRRPPGREPFDGAWYAAWTGDPVKGLSAAGRRGDAIEVRAGKRPVIGFSLEGLGEAAGWMDRKQRRAGGVTAMVAKGTGPASAISRAPLLPIIRQSIGLEPGRLPRRSAAVDRVAKEGCPDMGEPEKTVAGPYVLDDRNLLWTVFCGPSGSHALNATWAPIVTDRSGRLRRAFDEDDCDMGFTYDVGGRSACSPVLENFEFDGARGVLASGFQAASAAWWEGHFDLRVWNGRRFVTFREVDIGLGPNINPPYQNAAAYRSVWPPAYRAIVVRPGHIRRPSPETVLLR